MSSEAGRNLKSNEMFESGISIGTGLTFQLDQKMIWLNEIVLIMEPPGLSNIKQRNQAAKAIENALEIGGQYKIVFVVTLEAGRLKPDDIATINVVLKNIPKINFYGLKKE